LSFRNIRYDSARAEKAMTFLELRTHLCEWFGAMEENVTVLTAVAEVMIMTTVEQTFLRSY
jgi:hypothetical protein